MSYKVNKNKTAYVKYIQDGGNLLNSLNMPPMDTVFNMAGGLITAFSNTRDMERGNKGAQRADAMLDTAGTIASYTGPVGAAIDLGIKLGNAGGKRLWRIGTDTLMSDTVANNAETQGTIMAANAAQKNAQDFNNRGFSKLFTAGSNKRYRNAIKDSNERMLASKRIINEGQVSKDSLMNSYGMRSNAQTINYMGGYKPVSIGKKGMELKKRYKPSSKIESEGSIIVDGKLHSEKHNLDIDNITKKGVPVVSLEEGNKMVQQAEVERDELILSLEITEELIRLTKEDNQLEAGKILTKEIIKNTKDSKSKIIKNA